MDKWDEMELLESQELALAKELPRSVSRVFEHEGDYLLCFTLRDDAGRAHASSLRVRAINLNNFIGNQLAAKGEPAHRYKEATLAITTDASEVALNSAITLLVEAPFAMHNLQVWKCTNTVLQHCELDARGRTS